jgi:hypothetical protein
MNDDAWGGSDSYLVWNFHVDWTTPANSTFGVSGQPNHTLAAAAFDTNLCGYSRDCIPQPGGYSVDAISERLMYRAQYRNFGSHQSLVSNFTVDATGSDLAGIRWFELRNTGSGWTVHQQGTYAPDANHRWMGSIAQDGQGNMALGYSVSSATVYPSIRYAGRLAGDAAGTLPQAEATVIDGGGSQTGVNRWGDYSSMSVDPTDDCTFWYAQEYIQTTTGWGWQTRIGAFKFPSCTPGPSGSLRGTVTNASGGGAISGASVTIDALGLSTTTDGSGNYSFASVPVGTYSVTAAAYGFSPSTASGVVISDGVETVRNFSLTAASPANVSGTVRDSGHNWPLYAAIRISHVSGYNTTVFSDLTNGQYSVNLFLDTSYTFEVEAVYPGYKSVTQTVNVTTNPQTVNFSLGPNSACEAPGYQSQYTYFSDFDAGNGCFWVEKCLCLR